jgi:hypothetical protein
VFALSFILRFFSFYFGLSLLACVSSSLASVLFTKMGATAASKQASRDGTRKNGKKELGLFFKK